MKDNSYTNITANLFGIVIQKVSQKRCFDDGCFVLLTDKLAHRLEELYEATDWNSPDLDLLSMDLPEDIFAAEAINMELLKKHIGEYIYIACYGEPWEDLYEATSFVNGVEINFAEHPLYLGVASLHDDLIMNCNTNAVWDLNKAIGIMVKSGLTEEDIMKRFKKCMKQFDWDR